MQPQRLAVSDDGLHKGLDVVKTKPVRPGKFKLATGGFHPWRLPFARWRCHHLGEICLTGFHRFDKIFQAFQAAGVHTANAGKR